MNSASSNPSVVVSTPFAARLAHLDLDLANPDRPALISSVLQSCLQAGDGQPLSWQHVHAANIVQRLSWLLELSRLTGVHSLELRCVCPACACEISLSLDPWRFQPPGAASEFDCEPQAGVRLRLRLPTGEDQSRWAADGIEDFAQLATDLVLLIDAGPDVEPDQQSSEPIHRDWLPGIEDALEAVDPLTALEIHTECPDCGHAFDLPVDLEQLLLQRLMVEQTRVLRDIHHLARAYHWGEQEILALSPSRRSFYLRCIGQEGVQ